MELTISQFRRELFRLADAAMQGECVRFVHRGVRFRLIPEMESDPLTRTTPLQVVNPKLPDLDSEDLRKEMQKAWEEDWANL